MSRALLFAGVALAACIASAHAGSVSNAGYTAPSSAFQYDDGNKIYRTAFINMLPPNSPLNPNGAHGILDVAAVWKANNNYNGDQRNFCNTYGLKPPCLAWQLYINGMTGDNAYTNSHVHTQDPNLGNPALFQLAPPSANGVQITASTFKGAFSLKDDTPGFGGTTFPAAFLTGGDYNAITGPIPPNAKTFFNNLKTSWTTYYGNLHINGNPPMGADGPGLVQGFLQMPHSAALAASSVVAGTCTNA